MEKAYGLELLPEVLLPWFYANRRDLPWRKDRQPYHIWLSEIMLQQTRVEAVKGYYNRFLEKLPTVQTLAEADDDTLTKLWEGLGYYSRVRNLKKAAVIIVEQYNGEFPRNYEDVRKLPGIGDYTAGAICSIAFDEKTPAVDGNVLRVFSRLTEDATPIDQPAMKKKVSAALAEIYPQQAGDFTQALMELGATVCGPNRKPDCENCPCKGFCHSYAHGTAENFPVKTPPKKRKQQDMTVFILCCEGAYALEKREDSGLLAGLWQFPNTPGHLEPEQALDFLDNRHIIVKDILRQSDKKHIFTHIQWNMRGYYITVDSCCECFQKSGRRCSPGGIRPGGQVYPRPCRGIFRRPRLRVHHGLFRWRTLRRHVRYPVERSRCSRGPGN